MICWVMRNGVPFDVAHALDQDELLAYVITFSQFENGDLDWDWDTMRFVEKAK